MAVANVTGGVYSPRTTETYTSNFITDVPAGANVSTDIELPKGWYVLIVFGTHTAATTDPTLELSLYQNAGKTVTTPLPGNNMHDNVPDGVPAANALPLNVAINGINFYFLGVKSSNPNPATNPVYIPHGLKTTYVKNGGTAVDLTLVAKRVG